MHENVTYTCKTNSGTIVWSINDIQIHTEEQSQLFANRYRIYAPIPVEGTSSATVQLESVNNNTALQCHKDVGLLEGITASSGVITLSINSGKFSISHSYLHYLRLCVHTLLFTY